MLTNARPHQRRTFAHVFIALLTINHAVAQESSPFDHGPAAVWQALQNVQNTGTVLYVVAHPDDEDGALLCQLARGEGARTMLFSVTRGEGGANMISSDFFDALGVLRTLEHRAAARYYGTENFYSHGVDYGYSKQLQEALQSWEGVEPLLADLVRVIRRERPDVVAARFRGGPRDGHGHHQFSGVIAQRAFEAAADPSRFPEQIEEGLQPWQVAKLYHDNLTDEERDADSAEQLAVIDTGVEHPVLDLTYAQIARQGLRLQRSQAMGGVSLGGGPSFAYYKLINSHGVDVNPRETSLLDGVDTSIAGLAERCGVDDQQVAERLQAIQADVDQAVEAFSPGDLERCIPPLLQGLRQVRELMKLLGESNLPDQQQSELTHRLTQFEEEIEAAVAAALEIEFTATCVSATGQDNVLHLSPGDAAQVVPQIQQRDGEALQETWFGFDDASTEAWSIHNNSAATGELTTGGTSGRAFDVKAPADGKVTRPYWRRDSLNQARYDVLDDRYRGLPLPPPVLVAHAKLTIDDIEVRMARQVEVVGTNADAQPARYPLQVLPALSVSVAPRRRVIPQTNESFTVDVTVKNMQAGPAAGHLSLDASEDVSVEPASAPFDIAESGGTFSASFTVSRAANVSTETSAGSGSAEIRAVARLDDREYSESVRMITAPDLSRFPYYEPATLNVAWADLKLPHDLVVGYVRGTGDEVGEVLQTLGVSVEFLEEDDLATGDLDRFDALIIGVRAYAVRDDLVEHNDRVLEYVKQGGVTIVQYQTPEFDKNFGPYPYVMGRRPEEVSEQDAPVRILEPNHSLMQYPNAITGADFDGWVEQRGSKFLAEWDDRYVPLLACKDFEQPTQRGGLLYARYGDGAYVYAAYAWYRQLPQGVPGAHRIFANLIAHRQWLQENDD